MKKVKFKKIALFLIFIIFFLSVNAQQLSLDNLIHIQGLDVIELTDYLIGKGFTYGGAENDVNNSIIFNYSDNGNYANLIVNRSEITDNLIMYRFDSDRIYNSIKTKINAYNMQKIKSGIGYENPASKKDGIIYSVYQGKNYICAISVKNIPDYYKYSVSLYKKEDLVFYNIYAVLGISYPGIECTIKYDGSSLTLR